MRSTVMRQEERALNGTRHSHVVVTLPVRIQFPVYKRIARVWVTRRHDGFLAEVSHLSDMSRPIQSPALRQRGFRHAFVANANRNMSGLLLARDVSMSAADLEFEFPSWVPPRIRQAAVQIASSGQVPVLVVSRFATDARMRGVWQELGKKKRDDYQRTNTPSHPGTPPPQCDTWASLATSLRAHAAKERSFGRDAEAEKLEQTAAAVADRDRAGVSFESPPDMKHDMALAALFTLAIARFWQRPETATLKELQARIAFEREIGRLGVAKAFESLLGDPVAHRFIVARRRTDARLEAYAEAMTIECRKLFGQDMPGIVATLTNVAFARNDITRDRVRALTKVRPSAKSA
ncbi:MAG: hypothetical protein HOP13_01275 [Alphaproteobacteria bacterium]|nr:hypothetical protein [Alphaproteobacteria bacterium]